MTVINDNDCLDKKGSAIGKGNTGKGTFTILFIIFFVTEEKNVKMKDLKCKLSYVILVMWVLFYYSLYNFVVVCFDFKKKGEMVLHVLL